MFGNKIIKEGGKILLLLSPAKSFDMTHNVTYDNLPVSIPAFMDRSHCLLEILKTKSVQDVRDLMSVSSKVAELNIHRYQNFDIDAAEAKPSIFMFNGDVYKNIPVKQYSYDKLISLNERCVILSGLYGLLRPLDRIYPYRLEMGTKLSGSVSARSADIQFNNLYEFWAEAISSYLNQTNELIVNLASQEYFKAVMPAKIRNRIITIEFKECRNNKLSTIGILAKRARGMMTHYIIDNDIVDIEGIKSVDLGGYIYDSDMSDDNRMVFINNTN